MDSGVGGSEWLQSGSEWRCYLLRNAFNNSTSLMKWAVNYDLDLNN